MNNYGRCKFTPWMIFTVKSFTNFQIFIVRKSNHEYLDCKILNLKLFWVLGSNPFSKDSYERESLKFPKNRPVHGALT